MSQPDLFSRAPHFDSGVSLSPSDHVRLGKQLARVLAVMSDGRWYSVPAIKAAIAARFGTDDPETSISAQLRNARKPKHGGHDIERRRVGNIYQFRLLR